MPRDSEAKGQIGKMHGVCALSRPFSCLAACTLGLSPFAFGVPLPSSLPAPAFRVAVWRREEVRAHRSPLQLGGGAGQRLTCTPSCFELATIKRPLQINFAPCTCFPPVAE
jgi:hypothetical protein